MNNNVCPFCDLTRVRGADVYIENSFCAFFASRDPKIQAEAAFRQTYFPGPVSLSRWLIARRHSI